MLRSRLNVCLVTPLPPPRGGIGRWAEMILAYARGRGSPRLHVVDTSPRWRAIDDMRVWRRVIIGGATMVRHLPQVAWQLLRGCKVIHIATPGQLSIYRDIAIIVLGRIFRVPSIYHIRIGRVPDMAAASTWEWRMMSRAMRLAHTVVPLDMATERALRRYLPAVNVLRIPNCVDVRALPPASKAAATPMVLFLGWVIPTKGVEELVQAWADMAPAGWRLVIAGPGDPSYLRQVLQHYGPRNVEVFGEIPHAQAMQLLADAEVFVLPTYTEGFPNVIVEAMAAGKAIVTTPVGAIPEMLGEDGGILVPPKDVPALKEAMARVISDSALRRRLADCARSRARQYALPEVFRRLEKLWESVALGPRPARAARRAPASAPVQAAKVSRRKICMVSYLPPPYGGIGNWLLMVCQEAQRRGDVDIRVVDVSPRWRRIDDLTAWRRVAIGGMHMVRRDLLLVLRQLLSGCRIVHITTPGQLATNRDLFIIRLASLFHAAVIYHLHFGRIPDLSWQRTWEWDLLCRAMRQARRVVAIDEATEQTIRKHLPEVRVLRLPNCVDLLSLPEPVSANGQMPTVIYVGWVIPTKGIEELMAAWSQLNPPGWRLKIVGPGDGVYMGRLLDRHRPRNFEFTGEKPHEEAMRMLAESQVLVLPSHTEGFPNVILEAMAMGKAIVATTVGAIPEMVGEDGGLLVPPKQEAPLRDALAQVMADTDLRLRMGRAAREKAQAYALPAVFEQLVELWDTTAN